jgi:hypothetical protein
VPDPDTPCYLTVSTWQRTHRTLDKHPVAGEKPLVDLSGCERLTWAEACERAEALERQGYAITYEIRASITTD